MFPTIGSLLYTMIPFVLAVNPNTGDRNSGILWIVIAALAASAIIIVLMMVSSRKKRKRKRK